MASSENQSTAIDRKPKPLLGKESFNIPNCITLSRVMLAGVLFWYISTGNHWLLSAILFAVAAATDFLDGMIARRYGMVTVLGRILDPFADKIIICGTFVFLLEQGFAVTGINAWVVIIILGRELFITSLRAFVEREGLDFSASWSGKIKMGLQCAAVMGCLLAPTPQFSSENFTLLRDVLIWVAVVYTAYSGVDYLYRATQMYKTTKDAA